MTASQVNDIQFQIGFGAVQHFGKNLYTSNPPAIAELIANGWDAYATKVSVDFGTNPSQDKYLIVSDNGSGMSYETLSTRYAVSGLPKPKSEIDYCPKGFSIRPIMGRKGIGKFAAFSLGDVYNVITRVEQSEDWTMLILDYEDMYKKGLTNATVAVKTQQLTNSQLRELLPQSFSEIPDKGTIIYIPELRHRIITTSVEGLKKLLARRFAANLFSTHKFELEIAGTVQDLKKQFYDSEIQFVHYFGLNKDEEEDLKNRFSRAKKLVDVTDSFTDFISQTKTSGWLGSVKEPKNLKIETQGDGAGIIVYINGKLADENVLSNNQNQNMGAQYVVGEVQANYLQTEDVDPITSSRQGLNHALEEVDDFVGKITALRNSLVSKWKEYRGTDSKTPWYNHLHDIEQFEVVYKTLPTAQKQTLDRVAAEVLEGKNPELAHRYYPLILSFGLTQTIDNVAENIAEIAENDKLVDTFTMLFKDLHLDDALVVTRTVQNRLDVINLLEDDTQENVLESVLEDVLADNPWLINPTWENLPISQQDRFKYTLDNGDAISGRSDILVYTNESEHNKFPVIVELKRADGTGHQTPNAMEVLTQIDKYRQGLVRQRIAQDGNFNKDNFSRQNIPAYFIAGNKALSQYEPDDRTLFTNNKIKLLSFDEIVSNSRALYSNLISAMRE